MAINCIYIDIESNYKIVKERNQTIMKNKMMLLTLACTLALTSLVGCGKNEPDKEETVSESTEDAQDVEDVLNGGWADAEEEEEDNSSITRPTHYDVLPEVANATIADGEIYQIGDIVLYNDYRMSVDNVKEAVANTKTGAYVEEYEEDGLIGLRLYDPNGLDYNAAYLEFRYVDPSKDGALPVPEAGVYLEEVRISDYAEEQWGITDSVYLTGGYCLSDPILNDVKSNSKTHDEIIAELESLGCEKVDEVPNTIEEGKTGYYSDNETWIDFTLYDNYWTGKTFSNGSSVKYALDGTISFDDNGVCTRITDVGGLE